MYIQLYTIHIYVYIIYIDIYTHFVDVHTHFQFHMLVNFGGVSTWSFLDLDHSPAFYCH